MVGCRFTKEGSPGALPPRYRHLNSAYSARRNKIVGLFAIKSAVVMGAERVIVIEDVPERMALARPAGATDVIKFVQKGLTINSGQTHVKRYLEPLAKMISEGKIDPTFLITHRSNNLEDGPDLHKTFRDKKDGCVKVVFNLS